MGRRSGVHAHISYSSRPPVLPVSLFNGWWTGVSPVMGRILHEARASAPAVRNYHSRARAVRYVFIKFRIRRTTPAVARTDDSNSVTFRNSLLRIGRRPLSVSVVGAQVRPMQFAAV